MNEWEKEPDHKDFKYKGFDCEINRTEQIGILCGYVIINQNNKLFGKDYDSDLCMNLDVHGGITYTDSEDDGRWRIGFDCGHVGDYVPGIYPPYTKMFVDPDDLGGKAGEYRNIQFVTDEIKKMVDQVKTYEGQE